MRVQVGKQRFPGEEDGDDGGVHPDTKTKAKLRFRLKLQERNLDWF